MRSRGRALGYMTVLIWTGCTEARPVGGPLVRDSAGIEIVENPAHAPARWALTAEPALDIGVAEGELAYQLDRVVGAVLARSGELVIANAGTNELRFYDQDGTYLRSVGRTGEGPGEFAGLGSLVTRGDSLLAFDTRGFRFSVFDEQGALGRMTPLGAPYIGLLQSGHLVSYGIDPQGEPRPGTMVRSSAYLVRHTPDGVPLDTIARYPLNEAWIDHEIPGFSEPIFGRSTATLIRESRIWVADNAGYEIRELAPTGEIVRMIRRLGAARPVSDEDVARFVELRSERYRDADPGLRARDLGPYENQTPPATMPAFGRSGLLGRGLPWMVVAPDGSLWIQDYLAFPDEPPTWSVFDARGRLIATLDVPVGFEVASVRDDFVIGRWRDLLDVEHVRVHQTVRSSDDAP